MSNQNIEHEITTPFNAAATCSALIQSPEQQWIGEDYRLVEQLGSGAMGTVWRARDERLGRMVALKLVHTAGLEANDLDRVHREARLTASVEHANVVTVHDTGTTADGDFYMVMELLEGDDLLQYTGDDVQRTAEQTVKLLLPVLAGMKAAHRVNILHRDIKPANVFIANVDGRAVPKLVDFGVALRADQPSSHRLTQDGHLLGTPLYMAPEQLEGAANVNVTTDIWAFTIVLYEALCGSAPFEGSSLSSLFMSILTADLPLLADRIGDKDLDYILQKGAAKKGEDRWQSADEMAQALAHWLVARGETCDVSGESLSKWIDDPAFPIAWRPSSKHFTRPTLPSLSEWQRAASSGLRRISEHGKRQLTLAVGVPLVIFGAQAWATTGAAEAVPSVADPASEVQSATSNEALSSDWSATNTVATRLPAASWAEQNSASSSEHVGSSTAGRKAKSQRSGSAATSATSPTTKSQASSQKIDPYWGF